MILLEGTDLVGKTTLQKKLLKRLPRHIPGHATRRPEAFDHFADNLAQANRWAVQDRLHLSEIACSRARGEPRSPLDPNLHLLHHKLRYDHGMFVIFVWEDEDVIRQRYAEHGDAMYGLETILRQGREFRALIRTHPQLIDQDYCPTRDTNEETLDLLVQDYRAWNCHLASLKSSVYGNGTRWILPPCQLAESDK